MYLNFKNAKDALRYRRQTEGGSLKTNPDLYEEAVTMIEKSNLCPDQFLRQKPCIVAKVRKAINIANLVYGRHYGEADRNHLVGQGLRVNRILSSCSEVAMYAPEVNATSILWYLPECEMSSRMTRIDCKEHFGALVAEAIYDFPALPGKTPGENETFLYAMSDSNMFGIAVYLARQMDDLRILGRDYKNSSGEKIWQERNQTKDECFSFYEEMITVLSNRVHDPAVDKLRTELENTLKNTQLVLSIPVPEGAN